MLDTDIFFTPEDYEQLENAVNQGGLVAKTSAKKVGEGNKNKQGDSFESAAVINHHLDLAKDSRSYRTLREHLGWAIVVEGEAPKDKANFGKKITVFDLDAEQELGFYIGSFRVFSDLKDGVPVYSYVSPRGEALLNARVGNEVEFAGPTGKWFRYRVLKIE